MTTDQSKCPITGKEGYVAEEDCHCFCCGTHKGVTETTDQPTNQEPRLVPFGPKWGDSGRVVELGWTKDSVRAVLQSLLDVVNYSGMDAHDVCAELQQRLTRLLK